MDGWMDDYYELWQFGPQGKNKEIAIIKSAMDWLMTYTQRGMRSSQELRHSVKKLSYDPWLVLSWKREETGSQNTCPPPQESLHRYRTHSFAFTCDGDKPETIFNKTCHFVGNNDVRKCWKPQIQMSWYLVSQSQTKIDKLTSKIRTSGL